MLRKSVIYMLMLLPTFGASAAMTRSHDPLPTEGVSIGYANIGGHPETIGGLLATLVGNHVIAVAETKASVLSGTLSNYETIHSGGIPPLTILKHTSSPRGYVSSFKISQGSNTRPFFYGKVKVSAEKSILLCGIHLKSANAGKADAELAEIHNTLARVADFEKISHIIIVGDFNRADTEHARFFPYYTLGAISTAGGHSRWDLDRVYYFHKAGERPLNVNIELSPANNYDHGHIGYKITAFTS